MLASGVKIQDLWNGEWHKHFPSQSEADASVCCTLAFYFGRDPARMDRMFRQSKLMREKWDSPRGDSTYGQACITNAITVVTDTYQEPLRMTDVGNGERFAAQHRGAVRYCYAMKQWLVWDERRWKPDDGKAAMALAKLTARSLDLLVAQEPDEAKRKIFRKWATECERKHRLEAALFLAQSEPDMAIEMNELDADPLLLNVQNGTLDLRTGVLRPHSREDYITKLAPVDYDPEATRPNFDSLLNRLFEKVPNVRAYLQRIFGYSLTGLTNEQCFFIFYGMGSNGKSTILRAIFDLLGEYAKTTRPETFLAKQGDEGIRNDIAALAGARFVTSLESEQGKQFAEGLIKGVTGDEQVSARFMRKEFFSFLPQFKLFLGTNHKPTIKGTDHGIWRRVRCVPFLEVIDEKERDRSFGKKLQAESSGILNWLLEGCLAWQRDGLGEPVEVVKATDAYREEQDLLGQFLDDECVVEKDGTCTKGELYIDYREWCSLNGQRYPLTKTNFGRALRERGFTDARVGEDGVKGWAGVRRKATVGYKIGGRVV
jgi:putative DNA primase/helicase